MIKHETWRLLRAERIQRITMAMATHHFQQIQNLVVKMFTLDSISSCINSCYARLLAVRCRFADGADARFGADAADRFPLLSRGGSYVSAGRSSPESDRDTLFAGDTPRTSTPIS